MSIEVNLEVLKGQYIMAYGQWMHEEAAERECDIKEILRLQAKTMNIAQQLIELGVDPRDVLKEHYSIIQEGMNPCT